ncbi:hypothetical protein GCM10023339_07820 [Alloalcanivorax gelatiniphagus]
MGAAPRVRLGQRVADHIDRSGLPEGEDNIIVRAVAALADHHGRELPIDLLLDKSIPLAGGMAGGSADAAAALVAADRWHDLRTSDDDLLHLAAGLGSDVPFSLVGGTARGLGRGEIVTPVDDPGTWWWVAVPSTEGLSTPAVYRHFDTMRPDAPEVPASAEPVLEALATGEPVRLARALHNDLQAAAVDLRPELGELIALGEAEGALRGLVSGSGPTVVFLCDSADGATETGLGLAGAGHEVVLTATGPVAGAHAITAMGS